MAVQVREPFALVTDKTFIYLNAIVPKFSVKRDVLEAIVYDKELIEFMGFYQYWRIMTLLFGTMKSGFIEAQR